MFGGLDLVAMNKGQHCQYLPMETIVLQYLSIQISHVKPKAKVLELYNEAAISCLRLHLSKK
jgi:type VI protein secretion system component Hcp